MRRRVRAWPDSLTRCFPKELDNGVGQTAVVRHDRPVWTGRNHAAVYEMQIGASLVVDPAETYRRLASNRQRRIAEGGAMPIFTATAGFWLLLGILPINPGRARLELGS